MARDLRHVVLLAAALLAGCSNPPPPPPPIEEARAAEHAAYRSQRFDACLSAVPPGPQATTYNDWAEVVDECGQQAYWQTRTRFKDFQ